MAMLQITLPTDELWNHYQLEFMNIHQMNYHIRNESLVGFSDSVAAVFHICTIICNQTNEFFVLIIFLLCCCDP